MSGSVAGRLRGVPGRAVAAARGGVAGLVARLGWRRLALVGLALVVIASPWPTLTVAALAAYAVAAIGLPGFATALLPLAFPFAYRPKDLFGPDFPAVELLLLVALAASGLHLLATLRRAAAGGTGAAAILDLWDEAKRVLGGAFGAQAAALALIATLSLLTVADRTYLRESIREYRTVIVGPLLYFFLARHWLRARALRQVALVAFVGGAALVALIAIGQVITGRGTVAAEGVRRALGTYDHPNALALYLGRATILAAALALFLPAARRALLFALPVLAAALALTFSRGAFLGQLAALAALLAAFVLGRAATTPAAATARGRRGEPAATTGRFAGAGAVALAGGAALGLLALAVVGLSLLRAGSDSLGLRGLIWRSSLAMIRDHPAFGVGLDQFYYQYAPRYVVPAAWGERFTSHPHNLLLDFWLRLGIMGLAWVAWTIASLATRLARAWRPEPPPAPGKGRAARVAAPDPVVETARGERRALVVAAGVACIAALVHGLLDNFYFLIDLAFAWWLLLAIVQIGGGEEELAGGW